MLLGATVMTFPPEEPADVMTYLIVLLLLITSLHTCEGTWAATGAILTLKACLTTVAYDGGCQETLQQHGITLQEVLGRGMFGMVYKGESQKCCITSLCSREVHRQ